MNELNDGGPAFPGHVNSRPGILANAPPGMSLRAYYAGQALAGMANEEDNTTYAQVARWAVNYADALIAELNQTPDAKQLATNIVDSIMQEMDGRQSARLVMESQDGRFCSGWARKPLIDHITKILERSAAPPPRQ